MPTPDRTSRDRAGVERVLDALALPLIDGILDVKIRCAESAVTALDTGSATTAITVDVPSDALIIGRAVWVEEAFAGIDSTTATLSFTGGNTESAGTLAAFTAGGQLAGFLPIHSTDFRTTNTTQAQLVLSGGADNTPSAGSVKVGVFYVGTAPRRGA